MKNMDKTDIVNAILQLKQENNLFKDYFFPICSAFFTSLLGAFIAYKTVTHQEKKLEEKNKLHISNRWIIDIQGILTSLIALKVNYHGSLSSDPYKRAMQVPSFLMTAQHMEKDISEITFILPTSKSESGNGWVQITRVEALVKNYNLLLTMLDKRNELDFSVKQGLVKASSDNSYAQLNSEDIKKLSSKIDLVNLIDLTERSILMIDSLILECVDFLEEFPKVIEKTVKLNKVKNSVKLIKFDFSDKKSAEFLKLSPIGDYEKIAKLFGESAEGIKKRYGMQLG